MGSIIVVPLCPLLQLHCRVPKSHRAVELETFFGALKGFMSKQQVQCLTSL